MRFREVGLYDKSKQDSRMTRAISQSTCIQSSSFPEIIGWKVSKEYESKQKETKMKVAKLPMRRKIDSVI